MMPSAQQIAIDRLRVKASRRSAASIVKDLENGSWPVTLDEQWLFVRQLSVTAPRAELRLRSAQALQEKIAQAVDGSKPAARHADAVYFHSFPQLLAFLLRDLARADLAGKWYWQRWAWLLRETQDLAVARLLWESSDYLAAVIEELMAIDVLAVVWRRLSPDGALQILKKLPGTAAGEDSFSGMNEAARQSRFRSCLHLARKTFQGRHAELSPWREALAALPDTDPRCQLAAVIAGQQYCPLIAARDRQALVQAFFTLFGNQDAAAAAVVSGETESDSERDGQDRPARKEQSEVHGSDPASISEAQEPPADAARPAGNSGAHNVSGPQREVRAEHRSGAWLQDKPSFNVEPDDLPKDVSTVSKRLEPDEQSAGRSEIHTPPPSRRHSESDAASTPGLTLNTRCGGLFYLINALQHCDACMELLMQDQSDAFGSGWLWLVDLARRLDEDLDENILQFIAAQCGCKDSETLLALPAAAPMDDVEAMLAARYRERDVWDAALIQAPARVAATASHIDVYFPLSAVRLPVRLAALDINPGWVPWLGRVVTFYYRDGGSQG